jgi:hypothetical protein
MSQWYTLHRYLPEKLPSLSMENPLHHLHVDPQAARSQHLMCVVDAAIFSLAPCLPSQRAGARPGAPSSQLAGRAGAPSQRWRAVTGPGNALDIVIRRVRGFGRHHPLAGDVVRIDGAGAVHTHH